MVKLSFYWIPNYITSNFLAARLLENGAIPEETSFNSWSVHNDTVFLIVSCVAQNGHNGVDASWKLSETQVLHRSCSNQWFVWVIQHMGQCVHSHMEIGDIYTHGLFPHSTLKQWQSLKISIYICKMLMRTGRWQKSTWEICCSCCPNIVPRRSKWGINSISALATNGSAEHEGANQCEYACIQCCFLEHVSWYPHAQLWDHDWNVQCTVNA